MKRKLPLMLALLLAFATLTPAFAASPVYPSWITENTVNDHPRISKVYILSSSDDPAAIPTASFEQEGYTYSFLDMTREDQTVEDYKDYIKSLTLQSETKDTDKALALFEATMEVTTEDGYTGTLTLAPDSLEIAVSGYGTSSRTVTATRSYPNLSDADTALVPKTTEDNGHTLTLADVQWQEAGGYFHATATYTGTTTSRYATGYDVTAQYKGQVSKTIRDDVIYTAIFSGVPTIPLVEVRAMEAPEVETTNNSGKWLYAIPAALGICGVGAVGYYGYKKLKNKSKWEAFNQCDTK